MAVVFIPAPLRDLTAGDDRAVFDAATVRDVVEALEQRYPGIRERLCDGERLAAGLQVAVDQTLSTRGLQTKVQPDSEVHFLPAIGGG